jgi:arginase
MESWTMTTQAGRKRLHVFGVPIDLGQERRGVDMGPAAVRYAGLHAALLEIAQEVEDFGNIQVPLLEQLPSTHAPNAKHLHAVVAVCEEIYQAAAGSVRGGSTPIFLGGDHSVSIGSVAAVAAGGGRVGVLWVDAHGDFNTPATTPSGNIHGMALAALCGLGAPELVNVGFPGPKVRAEDVVVIGARSLDSGERRLLREAGVRVYTMRDVDTLGMAEIAARSLAHLNHVDRIHVSLDLDSLDSTEAPGVGTPVPGGLTYREAHLLMEILSDVKQVQSLDLVEINPILDVQNRTAQLAVELASSLFGKAIY